MSRHDDDKATRLRRDGCLHPAPEQVTDSRFDDMTFFDRRDLLQVKYEMLRRVRVDGLSVSESARRHGLSRPTYYAAQRGWTARGLIGLLPDKPGPKAARKLTPEIVAALRRARTRDPDLGMQDLAHMAAREFGVEVHARTVRRALAKKKR